jgi:threonine aldolase
MRQAGVLAAAGLYALDHMVDRMDEDHALARRLADGLRGLGWWIDRETIQTNVFFARPPDDVDTASMMIALEAAGLRVASPYTDRSMRLVTHYGITSEDIDVALAAFSAIPRGVTA